MTLINRLFIFLVCIVLTSCLTPKGIVGDVGTTSGSVEKMTEVNNNPDIKSLMLTYGGKKMPGIGLEGTLMTEKSSLIDVSYFHYLNFALPSKSARLFEKHFLSASYSYPLKKQHYFREGKLLLKPYDQQSFSNKVYFLKKDFRVLHLYNAVGGVEHGFTHFYSKTYSTYLKEKYSDNNLTIITPSNRLLYHGSYYLKLGVSSDKYVNSFVKGAVDGTKIKGLASRELHFGVNALVGFFAHMPLKNVKYTIYEGNQQEERIDEVDYRDYLDYSRLGIEFNFHWRIYAEHKMAIKFGGAVGMMPGYRDKGRWATGLLINANIAVGFGRIAR